MYFHSICPTNFVVYLLLPSKLKQTKQICSYFYSSSYLKRKTLKTIIFVAMLQHNKFFMLNTRNGNLLLIYVAYCFHSFKFIKKNKIYQEKSFPLIQNFFVICQLKLLLLRQYSKLFGEPLKPAAVVIKQVNKIRMVYHVLTVLLHLLGRISRQKNLHL